MELLLFVEKDERCFRELIAMASNLEAMACNLEDKLILIR